MNSRSAVQLPSEPYLMQAGEHLESLDGLWSRMTRAEKRDVTRVMLKALYIDVENERIVSIEPLPIFRIIFTEICDDLGVHII